MLKVIVIVIVLVIVIVIAIIIVIIINCFVNAPSIHVAGADTDTDETYGFYVAAENNTLDSLVLTRTLNMRAQGSQAPTANESPGANGFFHTFYEFLFYTFYMFFHAFVMVFHTVKKNI